MAGSVELVTRPKVFVGTAAIGVPSRQKSAMATPAIATNTGAPARNATPTRASSTCAIQAAGATAPSAKATAAAASARSRSLHRCAPSPLRQANRSAMSALPIGITSSLHQKGMSKGRVRPEPRSAMTSSTDA